MTRRALDRAWLALVWISLMILFSLGCQPRPPQQPQPSPTPTTAPTPQPIRLIGGCCDNMYTSPDEGADLDGWSCGSTTLVDQAAKYGWTHVYLRPGPFSDVGRPYLWTCASIANYAATKGVRPFVSVFDGWAIQRGLSEWRCRDLGLPLSESQLSWITDVVARLRGADFEVANETFKCAEMTSEWEAAVRQAIREAQEGFGYPRSLVCNQWYNCDRAQLDCTTIGGVFAVPASCGSGPTVLVEDDNAERTTQDWRAVIEAADRAGVQVGAWRGPMGYRQWQDLLAQPHNGPFPAHCPPVPSQEPDGIAYRCKTAQDGCPGGAEPDPEAQAIFDAATMAACAATGGVNCVGGTQIPDEMDWDRGYENFFLEVHHRGWCAGIHHAPNLHLGVEVGLWKPGRSDRIDFFHPLTSDRKWRTGAFMSHADKVWIAGQWRPGKRAAWQ